MIFSNGKIRTILKRMNLEICEHSSFLIIDQLVLNQTLSFEI